MEGEGDDDGNDDEGKRKPTTGLQPVDATQGTKRTHTES